MNQKELAPLINKITAHVNKHQEQLLNDVRTELAGTFTKAEIRDILNDFRYGLFNLLSVRGRRDTVKSILFAAIRWRK